MSLDDISSSGAKRRRAAELSEIKMGDAHSGSTSRPRRVPSKVPVEAAPESFNVSRLFERDVLLDARIRALGLIPLLAFVMHFIHKAYVLDPPRPGAMLWMCHVTALLQAMGLLFSWANAMRIASAWALIGVPGFVYSVVVINDATRLSWMTHIILPVLAIVVISQVRMDRKPLSFYVGTSMALFLLGHQAARHFTQPIWNINVAHRVETKAAVSYPVFFLIVCTLTVAMLTAAFLAFRRYFGPDEEPSIPEEPTQISAQLKRALR